MKVKQSESLVLSSLERAKTEALELEMSKIVKPLELPQKEKHFTATKMQTMLDAGFKRVADCVNKKARQVHAAEIARLKEEQNRVLRNKNTEIADLKEELEIVGDKHLKEILYLKERMESLSIDYIQLQMRPGIS